MQKIVLASSNQGKLREIQQVLAHLDMQLVPQSEFNVSDADETGLSFVENAIIKARHAARTSGLPALADDSGLEVDALQGKPGIYSARFAGEKATDGDNIQKLLSELEGVDSPQRSARFRCVLVYMRHADDPSPIIAEGSWEGFILDEQRGQNGFGYDPVFYIPEHQRAAAELEPEVKNQHSHRARALAQLVERMRHQVSSASN
ncbi:Nucleoside 5-triphosphatase RdgB (dHAPTP2C dITP2C XTP-specific) [gamma proteobacterium IMCC2047]|nr:Nucleoside 5-triphosphatase RdgB (dHAPTP2C dITP2C XTP-specific) [gamma proteobacterium IMCC2047]